MNQSNQPLVSVVIACYNHEFFVQDSIQSVIDQTYQNIELIIIDDGSKDGSVKKIQEMIPTCQQRFIRFEFRHRLNKGLSATLNEALEWCKGEYYSALASDDMMLPGKTKLQVDFLDANKNISAVFGGIKLIDNNNITISERVRQSKQYSFKDIILHQHDLPAPTQMIRLSALKNVGGYDPNILIEDWYMWLRLSSYSDLYYMDHLLCLYRQHETNISKNLEKMHSGRFDVLSCFKDSIYYEEAYKKIKWLNSLERIAFNKKSKLLKYFSIFLLNPIKAIEFFFRLK